MKKSSSLLPSFFFSLFKNQLLLLLKVSYFDIYLHVLNSMCCYSLFLIFQVLGIIAWLSAMEAEGFALFPDQSLLPETYNPSNPPILLM